MSQAPSGSGDPAAGPILVVDFGAQYAQLIARRVREAHVYSEIVPHTATAAELMARRPSGIVLSGGPKSVNDTPAPLIDPAIYDTGVPILGICYGAQLLVRQLGGEVSRTGRGEYGRTPLDVTAHSPLFVDWPAKTEVWMSHGDAITAVPDGFVATATSPDAPVAALHDADRAIFGVQFHPEVVHTERGRDLLERFLYGVCHCPPAWTHTSIIESAVKAVRAQVGSSPVLCALSGGVDSAVAAALVHKAIGDQLTCVYVDTGLMRAQESEQVEETFRRQFRIDLVHVKAADRFFEALAGVIDPEVKRKVIGELFIRIFEEVARDLVIEDYDPDASGPTRRLIAPQPAIWCRAPSIPTSSSRGRTVLQPSSPTTTWGVFPTTWPSIWSSPSGSCSKTRCGRWARSWASLPTSCGANRSPAPAWRCESSGR